MSELHLHVGRSEVRNLGVIHGHFELIDDGGARVRYPMDGDWQDLPRGRLPAPRGDLKLRIQFLHPGRHDIILLLGTPPRRHTITGYGYQVALSVDSERKGQVTSLDPARANWVWGAGQRGAILLVNNDLAGDDPDPGPDGHSEWSPLRIEPLGFEPLPPGLQLLLYATPGAARRFAVYRRDGDGRFERILGTPARAPDTEPLCFSPPIDPHGQEFFVEAHEYPGPDFEGLITVELHLRREGALVSTDRVVFRVAPWIMTPNTLRPQRVFACRVQRGAWVNADFLDALRDALEACNLALTEVGPFDDDFERWIQDEIEFGYVQSSQRVLPVVCESPRCNALQPYPETLRAPDFGHFQVGSDRPNSLDYFGNLEVSPPVKVQDRAYPLGRIVFGGRQHGDYRANSRQMMPDIRRFLYAQRVQAPFEVYTDWLEIGHVDEILCFVPADNARGFVVAVASPLRAREILQRVVRLDPAARMFVGLEHDWRGSGRSAEIEVAALLADTAFEEANGRYQSFMDRNVEILRAELGLDRDDLVPLPVLFQAKPDAERTVPFFPNLVNHLVLGEWSLAARPHGPRLDGDCVFETALRQALPWRTVRFLDDWYPYHALWGNLHCATNTQREPFPDVRWWEHRPPGAFDI